MTHPPSDPAAEAVSALRAKIADSLWSLRREDACRVADYLVNTALAPLLADIAALRAQRDEARFQAAQASSAAFAAEAPTEILQGLLITQEICADRLATKLAEARAALKPFADHYEGFAWADTVTPFRDEHVIASSTLGMLTVGHLRAAAGALTTAKGDEDVA